MNFIAMIENCLDSRKCRFRIVAEACARRRVEVDSFAVA